MLCMIHRLAKILDDIGRGSRTKLANDTGIPASIISDLCNGTDRINEDHIEKISKALKIPSWQLFADPKDVVPTEYVELMKGYLSLDPDRRRMFDDAILAAKYRTEVEKKTDPSPESLPDSKGGSTPRKRHK